MLRSRCAQFCPPVVHREIRTPYQICVWGALSRRDLYDDTRTSRQILFSSCVVNLLTLDGRSPQILSCAWGSADRNGLTYSAADTKPRGDDLRDRRRSSSAVRRMVSFRCSIRLCLSVNLSPDLFATAGPTRRRALPRAASPRLCPFSPR